MDGKVQYFHFNLTEDILGKYWELKGKHWTCYKY